MSFSLSTTSFEEKLKQLDEVVGWLKKSDINISRSRVSGYRSNIERLVEARANDTIGQLTAKGEFAAIVNSLLEASDLISIYQGLKSYSYTPLLASKIRSAIKGPEFADQENLRSGSHKARDFGFELFVASLFVRANYSWDLESPTDVAVNDGPINLYIECKRPTSRHSVRPSVRKAISQLKVRLLNAKPTATSYGLIAISIGKIINPQHFMLVSETDRSIDRRMNEESTHFIDEFQKNWKNPGNPKIIGVLLFLQTLATIESRHMLTPVMFLAVNNIVDKHSLSYSLLESIAKRLEIVISQ